jgi:3-methyladenine DNA glycosylase AlkD
MAAKTRIARKSPVKTTTASPRQQVAEVIASLKRLGSQRILDDMKNRYGILTAPGMAFGVGMGAMQKLAKSIGQDHALALALWETQYYEAQSVAALIDDPALVTASQMDQWVKDFDNWGICDTVCFKLFDQAKPAFAKAAQWSNSPREFIKRAGYVLMACLAAHDKTASDAKFVAFLPLIEQGADDDRNFVKKGVSWALRMIGRRSADLNRRAVELGEKLATSEHAARRWVGKDVLRDLAKLKARNSSKRA